MSELEKLEEYLKSHGYIMKHIVEQKPESNVNFHYFSNIPWRDQIIVYDEDGTRLWDAVCHFGSYGAEQGLLEVMGDVTYQDVEGWLTAEDVIKALEERRKRDG